MGVFICNLMADVTETETAIMAMQYTDARCQQSTVNRCSAYDAIVGLFHKFDETLTLEVRAYIALDMIRFHRAIIPPTASALRFYDPDVSFPLGDCC